MNKKAILYSLGAGWLLAACLLSLASCGGGGDDVPAQQVICLDCTGTSGNARLLCESQNASRKGC